MQRILYIDLLGTAHNVVLGTNYNLYKRIKHKVWKQIIIFVVGLFTGGANITFTVSVYKSSDPDKAVTQSVTVTTVYSDLIPIIRGGSELTIGRDSGWVAIDGSSSFDPDLEALDMTYLWQCEQVRQKS